MPAEVSPVEVQEAINKGYDRLANFRKSRLMFLRNYVGQYYDKEEGSVGTEAVNLIFNAIRTLVPNIVLNHPKHRIRSRYLAHKEYAELLELALNQQDKDLRIRDVYRRIIVDAIFSLGIMKTGLATSDSAIAFNEHDHIDVGQIYTEAVDFDNWVVDPQSKEHMFRDAAFMGDRILVPRQQLLDSGLYKNQWIEKLPSAGDRSQKDKRAHELSQRGIQQEDLYKLQDEVEIVEVWVPGADAVLTVPGTRDLKLKDYLRVEDYYGPDTGPYTLMALTPPVPGNPLPVPSVGVWNDLHTLANRMAKKIIDQAERQKDIIGYKRSAADDAESAMHAADGEAIAMDDPDGIRVHSFGGQQSKNEVHMQHLTSWFNMMAANPEAVGGQRIDADSATEARILSENASIGLEDMRDMVYTAAQDESRKRAWYLHTDPFIELPLIRRNRVEEPPIRTPAGIFPGGTRVEEEQVFLTPEARAGDFLDFNFEIEPESMGRKDSNTRFAEAMDFAVKIMPAALQAGQSALMLGIPFNVQAFIIRMAKDRGIDWMEEVFHDPEFQQRMQMMMMMGPQQQGSKGVGAGGTGGMAATLQNGQPGQVMGTDTPEQQTHQQEQEGANQSQRDLRSGTGFGF